MILLLALVPGLLAAPPGLPAPGPCPVQGRPCVLTLGGSEAPAASPECASAAWSELLRFTLPGRFADTNADRSFETVLEIRLDPVHDCGCARLKIFYGDAPAGWTVDVGNSPTNNGHGGDMGTTPDSAEIQVVERTLTVFTAARRQQVDRLLDAPLPPLARGVLQLDVCDQSLEADFAPARRGAEPLHWKLGTLSSKLLLSFGAGEGTQERASLWAAFNRVIHLDRGAPSRGRVGAGVRRVEISLSP